MQFTVIDVVATLYILCGCLITAMTDTKSHQLHWIMGFVVGISTGSLLAAIAPQTYIALEILLILIIAISFAELFQRYSVLGEYVIGGVFSVIVVMYLVNMILQWTPWTRTSGTYLVIVFLLIAPVGVSASQQLSKLLPEGTMTAVIGMHMLVLAVFHFLYLFEITNGQPYGLFSIYHDGIISDFNFEKSICEDFTCVSTALISPVFAMGVLLKRAMYPLSGASFEIVLDPKNNTGNKEII